MTLEEAIKHCEEKAKEQRAWAKELIGGLVVEDCLECAKEHEQLAEWLKDYKRLLEEKVKNEKYGSELARIVAEHEEVMSREIGSFECDGKCDSCELGVPIDGQFYDDGTPIHECGYKSGGDT